MTTGLARWIFQRLLRQLPDDPPPSDMDEVAEHRAAAEAKLAEAERDRDDLMRHTDDDFTKLVRYTFTPRQRRGT